MATALQIRDAEQTINSLEAERDLYKRRLATSEKCRDNLFAALRKKDEAMGMGTAPRDGTHILAFLYREADDEHKAFGEWREIWWRPYESIGMFMPWHAGDPADSHSGGPAPEHFGEGVPVAWLPKPTTPPLPLR